MQAEIEGRGKVFLVMFFVGGRARRYQDVSS